MPPRQYFSKTMGKALHHGTRTDSTSAVAGSDCCPLVAFRSTRIL